MKYIKCNICNEENEQNSHYCNNCGKNLSNIIEKTDVLFFFSSLMKWLGIIIMVLTIPGLYVVEMILSLDGGDPHRFSINILVICIIMITIGIILKKHTLTLCKKNINK